MVFWVQKILCCVNSEVRKYGSVVRNSVTAQFPGFLDLFQFHDVVINVVSRLFLIKSLKKRIALSLAF